ncbi:Acyl-CoA dehydrogenase, short-chain specific [subsurface metagenome]
MDFQLTEDQKMFRQTVRDFAKRELEPIAQRIDENEEYPFESIRKLGELGILGITIDEKYGGSGSTHIHWCIAMEELAYASAAVSFIMDITGGAGLACYPIYAYGNEEQKRRYVTPLIQGEKIGSFAMTEANAGSDAAALETTAVKDGDSYVLSGTKIFISNANVADIFVFFATMDKSLGHRGISAFIVEKGTPGLSIGSVYHKLGIRAAHNAEVILDGCRIPAENLLGEEGRGFRIALSTLDVCRVGIAAQAVGLARAALEASIAHTKERKQYGQAIADFQGIQWRLADIATEIDAARLLTYRAADLNDKGLPFTTEAAMAKDFASKVAMDATTEGIQMFGGYGYMMDSPMQRYFRDAKLTEIYEGTSEIQRLIISRAVLS